MYIQSTFSNASTNDGLWYPGEKIKPGQFVSFEASLNGKAYTRAYSIASRPDGNRFELCLNLVHGGTFSPHLFAMKPGDSVEVGQVLCIVEAMKLMNEIEADVAGEVVKSLMKNGQPIEYNQDLFAIRPKK